LDDLNVPGLNWHIRDIRFHSVESNPEDLDVWLEGDRIKLRIRNAGGAFSGVAYSPKLWPFQGHFTTHFNFHCDKGGFRNIELDLGLIKQFVMGRTMPLFEVRYSKFEMDGPSFHVDVDSDDWTVTTGSFLVNVFKDAYIFTM
jgi:hypothetical protein